jgi:hypothetical protein
VDDLERSGIEGGRGFDQGFVDLAGALAAAEDQ